jgi:hypothetical protein
MSKKSIEAQHELNEMAFELAYQAIRYSGLYKQIENLEWDSLAEQMKWKVRAYLDSLIDEELTKLEAK